MMGSAVAEINRLGAPFGSRGSYGTGAARSANRFEGTSCPPNERVVSRGSDYRAAAYIGGPTNFPYVYCSPIPAAAPPPPPPAPTINVQTTVSPTLQTQISPQISPVFAQMQDSPGSKQAGSTAQIQPGSMSAEGGGTSSGAPDSSAQMLEFMRMQSEQQAEQRAADTKIREQERRDAAAREDAFRQQQFAYQKEQDRIINERNAAIAAGDAERAAQAEAQYQESKAQAEAQYEKDQQAWEKTSATPGSFVSTTPFITNGPGREMVGMEVPAPMAPEKGGLPIPLIVAGVAALAVGGYFYSTKSRKKI